MDFGKLSKVADSKVEKPVGNRPAHKPIRKKVKDNCSADAYQRAMEIANNFDFATAEEPEEFFEQFYGAFEGGSNWASNLPEDAVEKLDSFDSAVEGNFSKEGVIDAANKFLKGISGPVDPDYSSDMFGGEGITCEGEVEDSCGGKFSDSCDDKKKGSKCVYMKQSGPDSYEFYLDKNRVKKCRGDEYASTKNDFKERGFDIKDISQAPFFKETKWYTDSKNAAKGSGKKVSDAIKQKVMDMAKTGGYKFSFVLDGETFENVGVAEIYDILGSKKLNQEMRKIFGPMSDEEIGDEFEFDIEYKGKPVHILASKKGASQRKLKQLEREKQGLKKGEFSKEVQLKRQYAKKKKLEAELAHVNKVIEQLEAGKEVDPAELEDGDEE